MAQKKTVLSGIQPSGSPTLGNYVGALRNWSLLQQPEHDCFYCVANLHAITVRQDADSLRQRAMDTVALLLACGDRSQGKHRVHPVPREGTRGAQLGAGLQYLYGRAEPHDPIQG